MTLTQWLRRYQRYIMVAVVVFLMLAWGVGPALRRLGATSGNEPATIRGEDVPMTEWVDAHQALGAVLRLGMLDPMSMWRLSQSGASMRTQNFYRVLAQDFARLVFPDSVSVSRPSILRLVVLTREAEARGIRTTLAERRDLLAGLRWLSRQGRFSSQRYREFIESTPYTDAQMDRLARRIVKVAKLLSLRKDGVLSTRAEAWMVYRHQNRRARIRYVKIDAEPLVKVLDLDADELRPFYEKHRDTIADPEAGTIGYMAPSRAKVEYAAAHVDKIAENVGVSAEEIEEYYEEHKDTEFVIEQEEDEGPAEDAEEESTEAEEAEKPEYESLDEVREQIREKLVREKAREEARERVENAMKALDAVADRYERGPQPLAQMARRYGLDYGVVSTEGGRTYLSQEELRERAPAGRQVAQFAFESEQMVNFPEKFTSGQGPYVVCQVLDVRDPEVRPFEEVKDRVRQDYLALKALDRAHELAKKLRDRAQEVGLKEAAAEMDERLADLLGEEAPEGEEPRGRLQVSESEFFRRKSRGVTGLGEDAPAVVEAAFEGDTGDLSAVRLESPVLAACVLETIERRPAPQEGFERSVQYLRFSHQERKQRRVMDAWMAGLLEHAELKEDISG